MYKDMMNLVCMVCIYAIYRATGVQTANSMVDIIESCKTLIMVYTMIYIYAHQFPYREMSILANCLLGYLFGRMLIYYKDH